MGKRTVFQNGEIVLADGVLHNGDVVVEDGVITVISHQGEGQSNADDIIIDCTERFICPGFIDLHNQGGNGFSVDGDTDEHVYGMARYHARYGTTGLLLTPPVGTGFRALLPRLAATVGTATGGAAILGIHAEGPFINPGKRGFMPEEAILSPDGAILDEIIGLCNGTLMEMTIAPEMDGALDLIHALAKQNIVASLGHSLATLTDVLRAVDHGASHTTHLFNAMSPIDRHEPGLTGAALFSGELTVEIIADGFHVHPWLLGLTVQNKGIVRTCLVTDAMPPAGLGEGTYTVFGQDVDSSGGKLTLAGNPSVLAGSVLTMDRAVANMINMVGYSISDAVFMASTTPSTVLGLDEKKGRIEVGFDADFAILDRMYYNRMTVVGGSVVYDADNEPDSQST